MQPRRRRDDLLGQLLRGGAASIAIHLLQRLRQRRRLLAVGAEGDDDDLANRRGGRLRAFVREERILDHRHHAFRPRRDEPGELRVEEPVGDLDAVESRLVEQLRDVAGGVVLEVQVRAHAEHVDVAHDRAVGVVAENLGNLDDLAPPVGHAGLVDEQVDGRGHLRPDGLVGEVDRGHHHHRLQAGERVTGGVGVNGRHRPVVAGVHRLQHIQGLAAADLADDDPVGAHAEAVANQLADRQLALPLHVGRAVLERDHVWVLDLELGRVLDRDDALHFGDVRREDVQCGGLAGAGAA